METITTYKLFRRGDHYVYPLFIDTPKLLCFGQWHDAWAPSEDILSRQPDGYYLIDLHNAIILHSEDKPKPIDLTFASMFDQRWVDIITNERGQRRYYDLGLSSDGRVIPFAHRPGWHSCREPSMPGVNMTDKVWCECLIPADDYTIVNRNINGMTHRSQPVEWFISKKIFIVRTI